MLITWRTYAIRIWAWQIIHWHGMNNTQIPGNTTDAENGFASWTCGNRLSSFESVILSPGCTLHHPVPGLSPGPSNQNLWAEARLGLIFLKALQVILKCDEGWNHYFKRRVITEKSSREPLGVTNEVLKHQTIKCQLEWFLSSLSSFISLLLLLLWPLLISQGFKWGKKGEQRGNV